MTHPSNRTRPRLRILILALLPGLAAFTTHHFDPTRTAPMHTSPQWHDGRFRNPQPLWNDIPGSLRSLFRRVPHRSPVPGELSTCQPTPDSLLAAPGQGMQATWLGHSTLYLDLEGTRILTDPVWGERTSPVSWAGPRRWIAPLIALEALPRPHVVTISHDHYDHLDRPTLLAMRNWDVRFVVPLGVGARLRAWGIPGNRITELDWWQSTTVGTLEITCTPARHASGRSLYDKDRTLWGGFAFRSPSHRVYFSGDTGMFPGLADIGTRLGPFDLTCIEAGAYGASWPDWHLGPEQAVRAHQMVQGRLLLPIHWGLFDLAAHSWTEPVERLLAAARPQGVSVVIPRPGQGFDPTQPAPLERWWPDLPWKTAEESPIQATPDGKRPEPMPAVSRS